MKLILPLFIVFEGIDGSGKTTLSNMTFNYYNKKGVPVINAKEPTDGIWGNKAKDILQGNTIASASELMKLFLLDREDDAKKNIIPSLNDKKMIIMDRYYFSNAAYQGAMGISPDSIITENNKKKFPEPDRIYLIDINPDEAIKRIAMRTDKDIFEKRSFLEKVREIYLSITDNRFLILNGIKKPEYLLKQIQDDINTNFIIS